MAYPITHSIGPQHPASASTSSPIISIPIPEQDPPLMRWRSANGSQKEIRYYERYESSYWSHDLKKQMPESVLKVILEKSKTARAHRPIEELCTINDDPALWPTWKGSSWNAVRYERNIRPVEGCFGSNSVVCEKVKSQVLRVSIPVVMYIAATILSLTLALWWTISHDDISGGFTMGAYVWGVVIFPTGYWHWMGKKRVDEEEDTTELEELGVSRASGTEDANEGSVEAG